MVSFKPITNIFSIEGLYSAFRFDWDDSFVFSGESHNFWEAVFVTSGEVEVTEDENVYTLGEGNLIFHAPMELHRIKSAGGSSPSGFILSFASSGKLPEVISGGVFTLDPTQVTEYAAICKKAIEFKGNDANPLLGQEVAALLSAFVIGLEAKSAATGTSVSQSAMEYRRIVSFMSEKVCENLTLSDIASKSNVSVSYVKLLFRTYAGVSPKSYFNQLRIRRATELLSRGTSVTEVSDIMNFSSPNYFSAFYKKHTGISPSEQQRGA
ncbi:MAG: helix-turn-helix domain-containing protein [Clostridia bacterium]|nr:helix-turn-helix domain-containing protein [Clostridia bacterium]